MAAFSFMAHAVNEKISSKIEYDNFAFSGASLAQVVLTRWCANTSPGKGFFIDRKENGYAG